MKFLNQRDYPDWLYVTRTDMEGEEKEYGKTTTVFTSGCGLCCAVMAADRLIPNSTFTLSDALDISYAQHANQGKGTDYDRFAPAFAEKLNLEWQTAGYIDEVRDWLRTGGVAVALCDGDREGRVGKFSHRGHFVAVIAEEPDGRMAVLDPDQYPGKYGEEGRQGFVELKYGFVALCQPQTLQDDSSKTKTPYYLFRRK